MFETGNNQQIERSDLEPNQDIWGASETPAAEKTTIKTHAIATSLKRKLILYLLLSAITFTTLILAPNAGISALLFVLIQAPLLFFLAPRKKPLLLLIPIAILALNAFLSANMIWRIPNLFVGMVLYAVMGLALAARFTVKERLLGFIGTVIEHVVYAFSYIPLPFKWGAETRKEHIPTIKRICIGVGISIPCLIFLVIMLSRADEIFLRALGDAVDWLTDLVHYELLLRILGGLVAGFFLFGVLYGAHRPKEGREAAAKRTITGDVMILNIVLTAVLLVYTFFVIIQFRYLFAPPDQLPYGLTFVTYARRGFFELLFLTGINIAFILLTVWLTKTKTGKGAKFIKILCLYLCAVTIALLVSSFYRMWLYGMDDGLTRLRFLVFGFLIFEAVGLLFTFAYIIRPKFNIVAVYCAIALTYYLLLNLVPMDRIIANDQANRYLRGERVGVHYVTTLSPDAASEVIRLWEQSGSEETRELVERYFRRYTPESGWRQWNLSMERYAAYGEVVKEQ